MRIDNGKDCNTFERKVANFDSLGIPDVVRLGEVSLNRSTAAPEEGAAVPGEVHPGCFELVFMAEGTGTCRTGEEEVLFHGGEMLMTYPDERHRYYDGKSHFYYLIFYCPPGGSSFMGMSSKASAALSSALYGAGRRVVPCGRQVFRLLADLVFFYFQQTPMRAELVAARLIELFHQVYLTLQKEERRAPAPEDRKKSLVAYVDARFQTLSGMDEVARAFHFSPSHVGRLFKEATGFTLHDYVMRRRIERAKTLLLEEGRTVASVAEELGFSSESHFFKTFRQYTATTPARYRQKNAPARME